MNYLFALSLSALTDVYTRYGAISDLLQIVDILPHERHDKFVNEMEKMKEMVDTVKLDDCPCTMSVKGKPYHWPSLHTDTREVLEKGSYRTVVLGQLSTDPTKTRAGAGVAREWLGEDRKSTAEKVYRRAGEVVTFLFDGLKEKVYSDADIVIINHARKLLSISSDMVKIKTNGAVSASTLTWKSFKSAASFFEPSVLDRVPEEEMMVQYREYCRRLEQLSEAEGAMKLTSKEILSKLLKPKEELCKDIEGVLSVLARACLSQGVEAIVESWVFILERHSTSTRGITDQVRLENELRVAINGPEVQHCEGVIREALKVGNMGLLSGEVSMSLTGRCPRPQRCHSGHIHLPPKRPECLSWRRREGVRKVGVGAV